MMDKQEERLRKSHVFLLKNPKTMQLGGIILMGKSSVEDDVPTAYTDGVNKKYGRKFLSTINDAQVNGLVMHENGHVFFRHVTHHKRIFKENAQLANVAADFVVNDMIVRLDDANIALPPGALWNTQFRNWSVIQVYDYLNKRKKELDKEKPQDGEPCDNPSNPDENNDSQGGEKLTNERGETDIDKMLRNLKDVKTIDEHDIEAGSEMDESKVSEGVDRALREGGLLAGILGGNKNRQIDELLEPKVDWREAFREFILAQCLGKDEYSWRRYNRRLLANDVYLPTAISETVGEITVAIDTSGSIGGEELASFASELVSIAETVTPEKIRILWWDTKVHGEQVFTGNYVGIEHMLKPLGGGGTRVSSVSEYLISKNVQTECVVVFTDGFVESDIKWDHNAPLLWLVTQNKSFTAPAGKVVKFDMEVFA
jgi:predicted metal-dependent peptidase